MSEGAFEIRSTEGLIVSGSAKVGGSLSVTGTETVSGTLNVSGTIGVTGTSNLNGPTNITGTTTLTGDTTQQGPFHVKGATDITGNVTLTGTQTVNSPGKITIAGGSSPATLANGQLSFGTGGVVEADTTNNGLRMIVSGGGRVYVGTGAASLQYGPNSVTVTGTQTTVQGTFIAQGGSKNFRMDHPNKPDTWLMHGSTESPVSGIEYWGEEILGEDGRFTVALPDYFEALAKQNGRTVLVTGRGFVADWDGIEAGAFTVSGPAGKRFSWLVKAERYGGDFEIESPKEPDDLSVDDDATGE